VEEGIHRAFLRGIKIPCVVFEMELSDAEFARVSGSFPSLPFAEPIPYNFLGLFCVALDIPLNRQRHFLCSQFVAYVLQRSKIVISQGIFFGDAPGFYAIKNKRLVYCAGCPVFLQLKETPPAKPGGVFYFVPKSGRPRRRGRARVAVVV
jgi:hypothetical protein